MIQAKVLFPAAFLLVATFPAWATPGDKLYIQKNGVNIRTGPGTTHSVLLTLNKGHELVEFSHDGQWINVGVARTGGKDGWVRRSLVVSVSPGGGTAAPARPKFDAFVRDVEKLNNKVKSVAGFHFFTRVENLGDGMVRVIAHDRWLAAPRPDRESNLKTVFDLWSAHEASGLPIAVHVVDSRGNLVMKRARQ